jgi:Ran GTPase-activating protein (RanGAP) involved in mRNA processing and transport
MMSAQHLTNLDLSGNAIGDKGAAALVEVLEGKVSVLTNSLLPPLQKIDLSSCSFAKGGTAQVLEALTKRGAFERLDLSNNVLGDSNLPAYSALARCSITDLRLNMCKMCTKGASLLFKTLSDHSTLLCTSVRYCYLSGNEIADSCVESLCLLLEKNTHLQAVDLGFNLFTDRHGATLRQAGSVSSSSHVEKKLYDLSINLVGNKCDPYMLETPGLSRAKSNFMFGVQPNSADPANHGFSHIPHSSRGHFMARKELDNHHRTFLPLNPFNTIN